MLDDDRAGSGRGAAGRRAGEKEKAKKSSDRRAAGDRLTGLEEEIERIDRALVALMVKRLQRAAELAGVQRAARLPLVEPAREAAMAQRVATMARQAGVQEDVREIFWPLLAASRRAALRAAS